ncbi:hypothetical protein ACQ4WX_03585 [Streptomyces lasalocidi]
MTRGPLPQGADRGVHAIRGRPRLVRARSFGRYDAVYADELGREQVQAPVEAVLVHADAAGQRGHQQGRVIAVFGRGVHGDEPASRMSSCPASSARTDASRAAARGRGGGRTASRRCFAPGPSRHQA